MRPAYETYSLLAILKDLKAKGYFHTLTIEGNVAYIPELQQSFAPEQMIIEEIHRVEGDSNNDEEAIIYALTSLSGIKGVIIDSFGTHADQAITEFISKAKEDRTHIQSS